MEEAVAVGQRAVGDAGDDRIHQVGGTGDVTQDQGGGAGGAGHGCSLGVWFTQVVCAACVNGAAGPRAARAPDDPAYDLVVSMAAGETDAATAAGLLAGWASPGE